MAASLAATCALAGCAGPHHPPAGPYLRGELIDNPHVPPFATAGWAPFSRDAVIAIARREWRLFGSPIHVATATPGPPPDPTQKPERQPGLWQRVGEYWWEGVPPDTPEASWTGKHDQFGQVFPPQSDGTYPWSAAFISYVMRIAGAGSRFPYSASHSTYINAAAAGSNPLLRAHDPGTYPPAPGDLICHGRGRAASLHFGDLPAATPFSSHCDLVVDKGTDNLTVVGGNVDDAVAATAVPISPAGLLADPVTPWCIVIEVAYDAPAV